MSKQARSARGQVVDFDLLAIKQQLATRPAPIGVSQRRKFIDEKDGIKHKEIIVTPVAPSTPEVPAALSVAAEAAQKSAEAAKPPKKVEAKPEATKTEAKKHHE